MLKHVLTGPLLLLCLAFANLSAAGDRPLHKPLAPVIVTIQPVRSDVTGDRIRPGDVVEFKITAVSGITAKEMSLDVRLKGGAKLEYGETSWKGEAAINEVITLMVAVRAPASGKGKVEAVVSQPAAHGPHFSSVAEFILGPDTQPKQEQQPGAKKNGKGRSIIEYE